MSVLTTSGLPSRVFLWSTPRGGSSVFYKSITANGNIKGYFEPYATAEHHGPDGRFTVTHKGEGHGLLFEPDYTFDAVKGWLDAEKPSNMDVFVKDFPYAIQDRFNLIPEGYKHSFLIRKPESVFKSYFRIFRHMGCDAEQYFRHFLPDSFSIFKSLTDVAEYVESDLNQDIVVVDIDDVMASPAEMIQKYCESVGFSYDEGLLRWDKGIPVNCPRAILAMESEFKWLDNVMSSTGWRMGVKKAVGHDDVNDFPEVVWKEIEAAEPYYRMLRNHDKCLRLGSD